MTESEFDVDTCLDRLAAGERDRLSRLFNHYRPRLRRLVRLRMDSRLTARAESDDVLQETYLDAVNQIDAYLARREVDFFVWLRGLAIQRLTKFHRYHMQTKRRTVKRELALPNRSSAMLFRHLASSVSTPSQQLQKHELREQIQSALEALAGSDKEIILMRHFEFLSNREVAQALGIKESTATMRYGRALARLRGNLLNNRGTGDSSL